MVETVATTSANTAGTVAERGVAAAFLRETARNAIKQSDDQSNASMLTFASLLEEYRQSFGYYCLTIGSGIDRSVILARRLERRLVQAMAGQDQPIWSEGDSYERCLNSTYTDYYLVNRLGVLRLRIPVDQYLVLRAMRTGAIVGDGALTGAQIDHAWSWSSQCQSYVHWYGRIASAAIQQVLITSISEPRGSRSSDRISLTWSNPGSSGARIAQEITSVLRPTSSFASAGIRRRNHSEQYGLPAIVPGFETSYTLTRVRHADEFLQALDASLNAPQSAAIAGESRAA